jgi:4-oxalocrotonate tautomerase
MVALRRQPANETGKRANMPEVIVYAIAGRSAEQKKGLMKDITDAVVKNFGAKAEAITVQIVESPKDSKAKGGIPFTERQHR